MSSQPLAKVGVPVEEIHELSMDLLEGLEHIQAPPALSAFALIMTLGRILSPEALNMEDELKFCQDVMDYTGAYWAKGAVN